MSTELIVEQKLETADKMGQLYLQKYESYMRDVAETSPNFKTAYRKFTNWDAYQIGQQFEQFSNYMNFNENSSFGQLGSLPTLAFDLVAATYGMSIAPLVSSVQTIDDIQGTVYFKQVTTSAARANLAAGAVWVDAKRGFVNGLEQYAGEKVVASLSLTAGTTITNLAGTGDAGKYDFLTPVRQNQKVSLLWTNVTGSTVKGQAFVEPLNDGTNTGVVYGSNGTIIGTMNYVTGVYTFTLNATSVLGDKFIITYYQDFEAAADVPEVEMSLTTSSVIAQAYVLKQKLSTMKAFQMNKRFGKLADDEALNDLVGAMAQIESSNLITILLGQANFIDGAALPGSAAITFPKANPGGQSDFEYRQGFRLKLLDQDASINQNSGRGLVNRYVTGHAGASFLASQTGFVKAAGNIGVGAHVYGYLDGIPVIRAPQLDTNTILGLYQNPTSPFESPAVTATYMPLFITDVMPTGQNPIQNQRAIATQKAFEGIVPNFVKKITLT